MCLTGCNSDSGKQARTQGGRATPRPTQPSGGLGTTTPCVTFSITTETVATQPSLRTRKQIGIGEDVRLTTTPSTTATWMIVDDDGDKGTLSTSSGTVTIYTACDRGKSVTIEASCSGHSARVTFTIVQPTQGRFATATDISSVTSTTIRVGFQAPPTMMPNDVSFRNCDLKEGTCPASTSGVFLVNPAPVHAATDSWVPFSSTVGADGTELSTSDTVSGTRSLSLFPASGTTDGRFHWPIPWRTQVRGGGTNGELIFDTLNHQLTYRASDRRMKMEKGNRSAQRTVP